MKIIVFVLSLLITTVVYATDNWTVYNGTTEAQTLTLCAKGPIQGDSSHSVTQTISPGEQMTYVFSGPDFSLCGSRYPCGSCYNVSNTSNTQLNSSSEVSGCSTITGECGGILSLCPLNGKLALQTGATCPSS